MALTAALLAEGQLPNSKTTLYTASGPVVVKFISLVNTDTVSLTMNLYVKRGTSRRILPVNMSLTTGAMYRDSDIALELTSGDLIEGDASTAAKVDYIIAGAA